MRPYSVEVWPCDDCRAIALASLSVGPTEWPTPTPSGKFSTIFMLFSFLSKPLLFQIHDVVDVISDIGVKSALEFALLLFLVLFSRSLLSPGLAGPVLMHLFPL